MDLVRLTLSFIKLRRLRFSFFLGFFLFSLGFGDEISNGQELKGERLYLSAIRTCERHFSNMAVISRRRFTKLSGKNDNAKSHDQIAFSIHSDNPAIRQKSPNTFLMRSRQAKSMSQYGDVVDSHSTELFAKIGDRTFQGDGKGVFGGQGTDQLFVVKELTGMMLKDEKAATIVGSTFDEINVESMALPFHSISSIYFKHANFAAVHHHHRISRFEYETEVDNIYNIVFSLHDRSCVMKYELAEQYGFLPAKMELYLRPESKNPLTAADSLGEMLYRTKTEWKNLDPKFSDSDNSLVAKNAKSVHWVPSRIVLEDFPTKRDPNHDIIEIDSEWEFISDPKALNVDAVLQTTSPNPIREIYEKLGTKLQLHIEERDKKKQKLRTVVE